ncbi:MAG: flagellar basal-body rod protein FlgG [Candidatus Brocadiia bacterium]
MLRSLFTSATGMKAQQLRVDNISNNIANVNTTGFKKTRLDFQDLLYETLVSPGAESVQGYQMPSGLEIGSGVRHISTLRNFKQGSLQPTGGKFDLAISGGGFFQIVQPALGQTVYTRDGSFRVNAQGQLVTAQGYLLSPQITVPSDTTDVAVGPDGTVTVRTGSSQDAQVVGQIQIASFPNPAGLEALGGNLYAETVASGSPTVGTPGANGLGELNHGFLEGSNVDVVTELVSLIIAQRAYEVNSRAIRTSDSMLEQANNVVR